MPIAHAPAHRAHEHHAPAQRLPRRVGRLEYAVVRALNAARRGYGLQPLRVVGGLSRIAGQHARDLVAHDLLSHSGSDGATYDHRIRQVVDARSVGETVIELHGRSTGRAIVRAWLLSPSHRADLLAPAFGRVGVGRAQIRGTSVVTADFASSP